MFGIKGKDVKNSKSQTKNVSSLRGTQISSTQKIINNASEHNFIARRNAQLNKVMNSQDVTTTHQPSRGTQGFATGARQQSFNSNPRTSKALQNFHKGSLKLEFILLTPRNEHIGFVMSVGGRQLFFPTPVVGIDLSKDLINLQDILTFRFLEKGLSLKNEKEHLTLLAFLQSQNIINFETRLIDDVQMYLVKNLQRTKGVASFLQNREEVMAFLAKGQTHFKSDRLIPFVRVESIVAHEGLDMRKPIKYSEDVIRILDGLRVTVFNRKYFVYNDYFEWRIRNMYYEQGIPVIKAYDINKREWMAEDELNLSATRYPKAFRVLAQAVSDQVKFMKPVDQKTFVTYGC